MEVEAMMLESATNIGNKQKTHTKQQQNEPKSKRGKSLFIQWQFHHYDINRTAIRRIYNKTLQGHDGFDAMTVCYSRQKICGIY
jgi:hypothetical protein